MKKIRVTYPIDVELFQDLMPNDDVQLFDFINAGQINEDIDLLIFPGGGDVDLKLYLPRQEQEDFVQYCYGIDSGRDDYESVLLRSALTGKRVNKILGVCRGVQFLNVKFGGTLFPDLGHYDLAHNRMHEIRHHSDSNLSFFKEVNSLHHQGLRIVGEIYRDEGIRAYPTQIASDRSGYVTEIVTWFKDRVLGVQFHPEYYHEKNPDKIKFREFLGNWIDGNTTILR